jgi:hypothetical protein
MIGHNPPVIKVNTMWNARERRLRRGAAPTVCDIVGEATTLMFGLIVMGIGYIGYPPCCP